VRQSIMTEAPAGWVITEATQFLDAAGWAARFSLVQLCASDLAQQAGRDAERLQHEKDDQAPSGWATGPRRAYRSPRSRISPRNLGRYGARSHPEAHMEACAFFAGQR